MEFEKIKQLVRSVVISSKDGLTIQAFLKDYEELMGKPPPLEKLGFRNIEEMLHNMPDVVEFYRSDQGQPMLRGISDEATKHIANMISRQKSAKSKNTKKRPRPLHSNYNRYPPQAMAYPNYPPFKPPVYSSSRNLPPRLQVKTSQNHIVNKPPVYKQEGNGKFQPLSELPLSTNSGASNQYPSPYENKPWSPPPMNFATPPLSPIREIKEKPKDSILKKKESPKPKLVPQTNKDILAKWAKENGIEIEYTSRQIGKSKDVRSIAVSLTVGKNKYSSFPLQTSTVAEAEEEAARKAVSALNILQGSKKYPEAATKTEQEIEELVKKITEIVIEFNAGLTGSTGIWNIKVEEQFKKKHEQLLPPHWLQLIASSPKIRIEKVNDQRAILYLKTKNQNSDLPPILNDNKNHSPPVPEHHGSGDTGLVKFYNSVEPIVLPSSNNWEVELVFVAQGDQVAIRLVEYNEAFSALNQEMNEFYEGGNARQAGNLLCPGCLCAVKEEGLWERVLVLAKQDKDLVEIYLVDFGDTIITSASSCFILEPQFCSIPYQAIWCNLIGLEEFRESKKCMELLAEGYLGSALIAQVHNIISSKIPPLEENTSLESYEESIANVILYDTSSDDDVNVNEALKDKLFKAQLCPILPEVGGFVTTTVQYISPSGVVGFVLSEEGMKTLKNVMEKVEEKAKNSLGHVTHPKKDELYCAKFGEEQEFYRALVINYDEKNPNEVEVYYVDYGNCEKIPLSYLASTDGFPPMFFDLPHQALKGTLSGLPPAGYKWSQKAVDTFYSLLPQEEESDALLKVVSHPAKGLPQIEILKRNNSKELLSINNMLAFQKELFIKIEDNAIAARKAPPPNLRNLQVKNGMKETKDISNEKTIHPNEVNSSSKENINEEGMPLKPPPIPEPGHFFNVYIPMVAHPNNFICQSFDTLPLLDHLMSDMENFYNNEENLVEMDPCLIFQNHFYAGRDGKKWYRICIKHIIQGDEADKKSLVVSAYFVDYGHYRALYLNDMQPLYNTFRELPFQAIPASLAGEKPLKQNWSTQDCLEFKALVEKRALVSIVRLKVPDTSNFPELGGKILTLTLIDTSKEGRGKYAYLA